MPANLGEEIVAAYLEYIRGCEFIQQNLYIPDTQGEIDVVGIGLEAKTIYVCEVAIHLTTGLYYPPSNVAKLTEKFSRDIEYANKYFPDYTRRYMLWSPVVKKSRDGSKFNQMTDVENIKQNIQAKYGVDLECVINEKFSDCLMELREYASKATKELKSPVLRLMQVEEFLNRHLGKNKK